MAVDMSGKHTTFINHSVTVATQFKAAYDAWVALREEWDSLDYGTTITDDAFQQTNTYMDAAMLRAFYTTQGNLVTFWEAGNGTNICSVIP